MFLVIKNKSGTSMKKILDAESPLEPTLYPKSMWMSVKVVDATSGRGGIGRVTERPDHRSSRLRDQEV